MGRAGCDGGVEDEGVTDMNAEAGGIEGDRKGAGFVLDPEAGVARIDGDDGSFDADEGANRQLRKPLNRGIFGRNTPLP